MRTRARLVVEAGPGGKSRVTELHDDPPIGLRLTSDGVLIVSTAQALLGDDDLELDVTVGPNARLRLRSVAATIAYASHSARFALRARVEKGGLLDAHLGTVIVTERCHLSIEANFSLAKEAALRWGEECLLGRANEKPGDVTFHTVLEYDKKVLYRSSLALGASSPASSSPSVVGSNRAIGSVLLVGGDLPLPGAGENWAVSCLEDGGVFATALGGDLGVVRSALDVALDQRATSKDESRPIPVAASATR